MYQQRLSRLMSREIQKAQSLNQILLKLKKISRLES